MRNAMGAPLLDLAAMYEVDTRVLIQGVKRNIERFPADFAFQLTKEEFEILRSQSVISRSGHGGRRTAPYVFTEQGVAMLSAVLHSPRALQVSIEIMRAFVRLQQMLQPSVEIVVFDLMGDHLLADTELGCQIPPISGAFQPGSQGGGRNEQFGGEGARRGLLPVVRSGEQPNVRRAGRDEHPVVERPTKQEALRVRVACRGHDGVRPVARHHGIHDPARFCG